MKKFSILKATRQSTEYSCAASALQSVLSYWGKDLDERELMKMLHTTEETGTYPDDIVKVARELKLEADVKENLTLDDIERSVKNGIPVIVLGQSWRSREDSNKALSEEWASGHYFVVLGMDNEYVYFQDPYINRGKGFITRQRFEDLWHNIRGLTPVDTVKQMHLGIFIRGVKPAKPQSYRQLEINEEHLQKFAPLQFVAIKYQGNVVPVEAVQELMAEQERGIIRPIAYLMMAKSKDGTIAAIEGSELGEEEFAEVAALLAVMAGMGVRDLKAAKAAAEEALQAEELIFGLSEKDIQLLAESLPKEGSAILLIFEHVWAKRLKDTINRAGGVIVAQELVRPETLIKWGTLLAKARKEKCE